MCVKWQKVKLTAQPNMISNQVSITVPNLFNVSYKEPDLQSDFQFKAAQTNIITNVLVCVQ